MQQIFFLEPEPGAGHSWTGSTTLVPLASFYFYLNHILNICVWVACCRACHRGGRRRRAPAEHDAWARGSSWRRLSGRCRCSPPPGRPAPPPRQDRAPGHAPARGLIDCNRLNRDWYRTGTYRYVFLRLASKGGENQWPGGAYVWNFIQSAANLVQLFI